MTTQHNLRQQILTLHYIYPLPLQKLTLLLNYVQPAEQIMDIHPHKLATLFSISVEKAAKLKRQFYEFLTVPLEGIYTENNYSAILFNDPLYPKELLHLINPPTVLYVKGDASLLQLEKIAVIGSRHATNYTKRALNYIIPPLVKEQYAIVSGFAKGADTMAHEQTIAMGGKTIAVLGSGFDHIYPKTNKSLFEYMSKCHCIVTEYPPYMEPKKWHFPMRNRIISGLSKALVVTEAAERSGTLITTEHALENGKDVFVVPGPIDCELSKGTNLLLKEGAIPVWNGYQIVDELKLIFT